MFKLVVALITSLALISSVSQAQMKTTPAPAQVSSNAPQVGELDTRISLNLKKVSLKSALQNIADQATLKVAFGEAIERLDRTVTVRENNISVRRGLELVLRGTGISYRLSGRQLVLEKKAGAIANVKATGTLQGRVTEKATGQPVTGARVMILATTFVQTTRANGMYSISGIPAGTYQVRVTRLGFTPMEQRIVIADSGTATLNIVLTPLPTTLEEVVTTATGDQKRMEIGNSIATIRADSIVPYAPINNLTDLIAGRAPGVQVMYASGLTGSPAAIRIRGLSSINGSLDPIVILDGIRIESVPGVDLSTTSATNSTFSPTGTKRTTTSRLDDIDPSTIESIDIVRGPSAATLYGTDAANGVIVIKTKRGQAGPPRWTLTYNLGTISMPKRFPENYRTWGKTLVSPGSSTCLLLSAAAGSCTIDSVTYFNPMNHKETSPFQTGLQSTYGMQVSGGAPTLRYFLSAGLFDEVGTLQMPPDDIAFVRATRGGDKLPEWQMHPNALKRVNIGGNMAASLGGKADVTVSTSYVQQSSRRVPLLPSSTSGTGYNDPATNGWGNSLRPRQFVTRNAQDVNRMINSISGNWRPFNWITNRGTVGLDFKNEAFNTLTRPGEFNATNTGGHTTQRITGTSYTGNLGTTMTLPLPFGASSRTSFGAQYNRFRDQQLQANATGLALGNETITGATTIGVPVESQKENAVGGLYMEQVTTLWPGMYLTGPSFRMDVGSAFGSNFRGSLYPKANFSWLPLFGNLIPSLTSLSKSIQLDNIRIRAAFGHSGIQPGPNGGLRLFNAGQGNFNGRIDNLAAIRQIGNTLLRPERSSEFEGGIDAGLFNDRLTVEGTYYWKYTKDAIMQNRPLPSSVGAFTQAQNIGEVKNTGGEFSVKAQPFQGSMLSWEVSAGGSVNHNKLVRVDSTYHRVDQGESWRQNYLVEGYPLNGRWQRPILGYRDADGDGIINTNEVQIGDTAVFIGNGTPETQLNMGTTLGFLNNRLRVTALFDYRGQFAQVNADLFFRCAHRVIGAGSGGNCRAANDPSAPLVLQAIAAAKATAAPNRTAFGYIERTSFVRFRELSFTFTAPPKVVRFARARSLNVTLNGRNLGVFTKYRGADPEVASDFDIEKREDSGGVPPSRLWRLNFNVGY